jgi:SAM-dependent methyltransferase
VANAGFAALAPPPALDVACGLGQNALWLAGTGLPVMGVDASEQAVRRARDGATRRRSPALFQVLDLESGAPLPGGRAHWGLIIVFHYLHRELLPRIPESLAPEGLLIYKTHLAHPLRAPDARPRRAEFLLRPGELLAAFPLLQVLVYREWAAPEGGAFAAIVARRAAYSS